MNLEIFPCSGGFAEGFRRAGVAFGTVIERDPNACDSYGHNHGHRPLQMDVHDFARMVRDGWRPPAPIDFLMADPPCTPWSRAGKREGLADERDCLAVTAEMIALLRPRAYLIGNIPGLQDSTSWHVVQDVIGGLASHGYCVADYVSLDAADYGVPQHRVRPFWFGHLDGPCIRWPAPTHGAPTEQFAIGGHALKPWVTCRQALQHLPLEELGRPVRMRIRPKGEDGTRHGGDRSRCSEPDRPAKTVVTKPERKGGQILLPRDNHPPSEPDRPSRTIKTNGGRRAQGGAILPANAKHPICQPDAPAMTVTAHLGATGGAQGGAALAWPWDRPGTTIVSKTTMAAPGHHTRANLSDPNAVILSERAAAILQGFPEGWLFSGDTKKARWSQIGQAMPPGLAEAVARAVVEQFAAARREAA